LSYISGERRIGHSICAIFIVSKPGIMKKLYFSTLLFILSCITGSLLYAQAPVPVSTDVPGDQTAGLNNGSPDTRVADARGQGLAGGFFAYAENNIVVLRWQPLDETNTDHFVIEHAGDTVHFMSLHEVSARGGMGSGLAYEDEDSYPDTRLNYYRLKVVTRDGEVYYSPTVAVDMSGRTVLTLKPTVLNMGSTLHVDGEDHQPLTIDFFDEGGVRRGSYLVNSNYFDISTSGWSKGIYFYRISDPYHPLINSGKIMVL
jgi:hypothetical protein